MSERDDDDITAARHRLVTIGPRAVLRAPRGRLYRRSLDSMRGRVVARRYQIVREIGAGGMGNVYEAIDLETRETVALKALQPGTYDAVRLKRLRREAEVATRIHSDQVCKIHYLGVDRGTPFIVMERLRGETLRVRVADDGPLAFEDAIALFLQLLDALIATHDAGVIHRDIKPTNIFLTSSRGRYPEMKLIDFGLARSLDGPDSRPEHVTASDGVPGTLHYLAPEQLLGLGDVDERVDVYAAGLVLFEMLAGRRAIGGGTYDEIARAIALDAPPSISEIRRDVPAIIDDVLAMAMAKDRARRFASARALRTALHATLEKIEPLSKAVSGVRKRAPMASDDYEDEVPTQRHA